MLKLAYKVDIMLNIFLISLCCLMVLVCVWAQPEHFTDLEQRIQGLEQDQRRLEQDQMMAETMRMIEENNRRQQAEFKEIFQRPVEPTQEPYYPKPYSVPRPPNPTE